MAATTCRSGSIRRRPSACPRLRALRILFIADVVGAPGRRALDARLKTLRSELEIDVCVVNGENAADGIGITPRLADQLLAFGADAITLGNHAFRRAEIGAYLDASERVVRPANTSTNTPGRGLAVVAAANGSHLAVINVLGSLFLHPATSMFELIDGLVDEARTDTPIVLVDVHAEATSEKVALARWLDGRVTAVVGTHTHVQTSDATILPRGTAFITDAGMTGPHDSVIGVETDLAIRRMRTGLPVRFATAQGDVRIEGALIECDAGTGRASSIEALRVPFS
jgi:metallophosphoesterase (TIGR00282 family)